MPDAHRIRALVADIEDNRRAKVDAASQLARLRARAPCERGRACTHARAPTSTTGHAGVNPCKGTARVSTGARTPTRMH
eukprot:1403582-Pleurochrysis_carterae.AAC.1